MSSQSKAPVHSQPLIFPPAQTHKSTLIILHGRGSTADKFARPLLNHAVSSLETEPAAGADSSTDLRKSFQAHFPNTKFIFPTAPLRRAVVFKRSLTHQWFDNWSLTQSELKQHLQIPGLRETSLYLHGLLREEIEVVGAGNVVLMGISQGCAASIVATLLWEGEPFGALIGMCGYLPFRMGMQECIEETGDGDDDDALVGHGTTDSDEEDMFERDSESGENGTKFEKAVGWLREELQVEDIGGQQSESPAIQSIPVFMGHGSDDEKVPSAFGKLANEFLGSLDVDVNWKEYDGLGHWYSEDMLRDIVCFLKGKKGIV